MSKITVKTSTEKEFFARGRATARATDAGGKLSASKLISFEDAADLVKLMSSARLALLRAVKEAPGSITEIAQRLQRDRSAVTRDVAQLQNAGLLSVQVQPLAGHGRMKFVRATAQRFRLQAEVA